MLDFITNNFPLILASFVSLVSIVSTVLIARYQAKNTVDLKRMELFFNAKAEAYAKFIDALTKDIGVEKPVSLSDIRSVYKAHAIASMFSSKDLQDETFGLYIENTDMILTAMGIDPKEVDKNQELDRIGNRVDKMVKLMREEIKQYDDKKNRKYAFTSRQNRRCHSKKQK